jgi:hypothetical protein
MTVDRKHATAGFWITVTLIVVLALYPLSFGPACWVTSRTGIGILYLPDVYRPVLWAMSCGGVAAHLLNWYAQLGASPGWAWVDMSDSGRPAWIWWFTP